MHSLVILDVSGNGFGYSNRLCCLTCKILISVQNTVMLDISRDVVTEMCPSLLRLPSRVALVCALVEICRNVFD